MEFLLNKKFKVLSSAFVFWLLLVPAIENYADLTEDFPFEEADQDDSVFVFDAPSFEKSFFQRVVISKILCFTVLGCESKDTPNFFVLDFRLNEPVQPKVQTNRTHWCRAPPDYQITIYSV